eukprot:Nitzschia sp. Nitz4//scaffold79_size90958//75982//77611//NITZ4_005039-RA/size90958-augustus-gene-0.179-mRNA-1//-1//CDS//3329558291//6459//frame0
MGNQHSGEKQRLHGNLISNRERTVEDAYRISDHSLGAGTSTQIVAATMKKYHKTERSSGVAIKLYDGKAQVHPDLKKEAMILGQMDHPNIIRLYEVARQGPRISLVLELCTGGPLLDRKPFKDAQASSIMRQLLSAVSYMHSKNIVHRDIDCSNIMYRTEAEDADIKLIDFGSATELEMVPNHPGAFKFLKEKTGSLHVMAPEVIKQRYGPKADVWSCGIVAYTLINNGKHPFLGSSVEEMERKILQGSIDYRGWKGSDKAKNFVQDTAMVNAGFRLTAAAALKHPWVEKTVASWKLPNELVISFDLFRVAPPLKRIALNCLATKAPPTRYRGLFTSLDTTESGTLTKEEFMEGFKHSGNNQEELDDLFEKLDVNMNGEIMYTEFMAATLEADGELEEAQLEEAFDMISKKSKSITKKHILKLVGEEQKNILKKSGASGQEKKSKQHKLKEAIDEIFATKDKYSYEDFARLFEHGFDANRSMDPITETSLNEEQLSALKDDDLRKHMTTISEDDD